MWCAATDSTFRRHERPGHALLVGKCIHCNRKVVVDVDPDGTSHATLEHIRPRTHGGGNTRLNLAVACGGCNASKGYRLDAKPWSDPMLRAVVERLTERRRTRLRAPLSGLRLPPLSGREAEDWRGDADL